MKNNYLVLFFLFFSHLIIGQTEVKPFITEKNKTLPIERNSYANKKERAKREFAIAKYYCERAYDNKGYINAYYWLQKAELDDYCNEYLIDKVCQSNLLYYLKGKCEKENKNYLKAIESFTRSITITSKNSNSLFSDKIFAKYGYRFYEKNTYRIDFPERKEDSTHKSSNEYLIKVAKINSIKKPKDFSIEEFRLYKQASLDSLAAVEAADEAIAAVSSYAVQFALDDNDTTIIYDSIVLGGKYLKTIENSFRGENAYEGYIWRGECKVNLQDYLGAINDIKQYHLVTKDSNSVTCFIYALSAYYLDKNKTALQYFSKAINMEKDYSPIYVQGMALDITLNIGNENLILCYLLRGRLLYNSGLKEKACLDWSSALDLGSDEAIKLINDYCNK